MFPRAAKDPNSRLNKAENGSVQLMAEMYRLIPEPPHPRRSPERGDVPFLWAYFPPPPALRTILIQFDGALRFRRRH